MTMFDTLPPSYDNLKTTIWFSTRKNLKPRYKCPVVPWLLRQTHPLIHVAQVNDESSCFERPHSSPPCFLPAHPLAAPNTRPTQLRCVAAKPMGRPFQQPPTRTSRTARRRRRLPVIRLRHPSELRTGCEPFSLHSHH